MRRLTMAVIGLGILLLSSGPAFSQACTSPGSIVSVKNTRIGNREYVIFNLKKPTSATYTVTTETGPFVEDPSENPVTVAGSKFKMIRFQGVFWTCSINEIFSLPKPIIKDIKSTSQFEGTIEYVIGYRNPPPKYITTYTYDVLSIRKVVMMFK
ncbi:MAG TPA: hypothetical protein VJT09_10265 [Pyrinomonadaceae bacterium]|nr:hypothetical protein [Pyrinomonadaceae bacterium]